MATPSFTTEIMDVFTFPIGDPNTKQSVFQHDERVFLGVIHRIEPLMDMPYRVVFFIRRVFNLGYGEDRLTFDVLWQPATTAYTDGRYGTRAPAILSTYDLPEIRIRPGWYLDDALRHASDRRELFDGLRTNDYGQDTYPGYWSLVAMVIVTDPTMPGRPLHAEVSRPWYYYIQYR